MDYFKFQQLECKQCPYCKGYIEEYAATINPGGVIYVVTCKDGISRTCEKGVNKPANCLKLSITWLKLEGKLKHTARKIKAYKNYYERMSD